MIIFYKAAHILSTGDKICSAITCLRGARSHQGSPLSFEALHLALIEGQVAPAR